LTDSTPKFATICSSETLMVLIGLSSKVTTGARPKSRPLMVSALRA
jgi:hypothetical protein